MESLVKYLVAIVATVFGLPLDGHAPSGMLASSQDGVINLAYVAEAGMDVEFREVTGGVSEHIRTVRTDKNGVAPVVNATRWRCDRLERRFTARGVTNAGVVYTGEYEVKTPSCATRLDVTVPRHVNRGKLVTVRLVDRFKLGDLPVTTCVSGGGLKRRCSSTSLSADESGVLLRYRAKQHGRIRVAMRLDRFKSERLVAVGRTRPAAPKSAPVLLATGDSTIQGIDSFLDDKIGATTRVVSDFHVGTGITTPGEVTWKQFAGWQTDKNQQRVTVISIGANEGYSFTSDNPCCEEKWVHTYANYLKAMIKTYTAHGGHVAWLTLPMPKQALRQDITRAVNQAIGEAAAGNKDVVVVDLGAVFTPGGVYSDDIDYNGQRTRVREEDGLHLNVAGTRIAADTVIAELNKTTWLQPSG